MTLEQAFDIAEEFLHPRAVRFGEPGWRLWTTDESKKIMRLAHDIHRRWKASTQSLGRNDGAMNEGGDEN